MASKEQTLAEFYENYGVTRDDLRDALEAALGDRPVTYAALEGLWYSKDISWLRHGITKKVAD